MIHHERLLELEACYLFELSSNVITYREQPMKIRYPDGDRLRLYTPDFELTLKTGEVVLVEIKHSTILARTEIHHKYHQISAHMQRVGQAYFILTDAALRLEPRLSSLRYAYGQLTKQRLTQDHLDSFLAQLTPLTSPSIKEVNLLLKPYGVSAFDLLASGHLVCELTQPVQESTRVFTNEENGHAWFCISEELSI